MKNMAWFYHNEHSLTINVYVKSGAKRTEIIGLYNDALKMTIASLPIEGSANRALLKYLASVLDVPLRHVSLKQGQRSRYKKVVIVGSNIDPRTMELLLLNKNQ